MTRRLLRAAASLFGLGALVGGLPALLVGAVGWPLPHGLPSPAELRAALDGGWRPGERFVLGLLAVLVWLLWAQILRHVLAQLRLQIRLQRAVATTGDALAVELAYASLPRRGLSQRVAGWLVGGLMMAGPLVPSAAMATPSRPVPVVMTVTRATAEPLTHAAFAEPAPALVPSAPTYVVHTWAERRDCLWNIAQRYLGDPFRWTEIRELNADRVQSDGRNLGEDPSSWVYPGWELLLPADATGADVVPARPAPATSSAGASISTAAPPTPAPSPQLPAVTGPTATVAPPSTAVATTAPSAAVTTSTRSSTSATAVPAAASAPPASAPQAPAPTSPAPTAAPAPASAQPAKGKGKVLAVSPWATRAAMAGALGLPIFALGGWLTRLRRGRAAQVSHARPGRDVVRPADPELEELEARAWAIAADEAEEWVDAALRALTAVLGESSLAGAPQVRCVRAGEMGIEVLLGEPFPVAPEGWEAVDGGHVWRPAPDVGLGELRSQGAGQAALTPALVSLGATPEGPILADLEGFGALAVEGDAARVRAFLAGAALELASASWAQGVDLRTYGLAGFERLEGAATDGAALVRDARSTAQLVGPGLGSHPSALAARVEGFGAEPWYPMVVIVGPDADPAVAQDLVEVGAARTGVAVVAAGAHEGAQWQLIVGPQGTAVLKPLGLDVRMAGISDVPGARAEEPAATSHGAEGADLAPTAPPAIQTRGVPVVADEPIASANGSIARGEAAEATPEPEALVVDQGGLDEEAISSAFGALAVVSELDDVTAPTPFVAPSKARRPTLRRREDSQVWVSILRRSPEVTGWVHDLRSRRKLAEVVMYLAVFGPDRPIPSMELRRECWPPTLVPGGPGGRDTLREVSADAFHQAMSRLRRQLGQAPDGSWHLPLAQDGAYPLGAGVGCDWTLFRALSALGAEAAAHHETDKAVAFYREALELIEGEPFADVAPGTCVWADSLHLRTDIGLAVSKAAAELADLAMASDPETAVWATQQGLLLLPTQLELFDSWMVAATELGDAGALKRGLDAKCWAHNQLDPEGGVPPATMKLYRDLMTKLDERGRTAMAGRAQG